MTFGAQTTEREAFDIINICAEHGVNVIDTAEMYPVYPSKSTYGLSETIIGNYFAKNKRRNRYFISTKFASSNTLGVGATGLTWIRGGKEGLFPSRVNIRKAVDASLSRLRVDHIDLYQIHWPVREVPFGKTVEYHAVPRKQDVDVICDTINCLNELIGNGKILNYGLSNETPWGIMKTLALCGSMNAIKPVSLQSQYNLINRSIDITVKEICLQEGMSILGYGPLAGGILSGKYLDDARPSDARYTKWQGPKNRYFNSNITAAVEAYKEASDRLEMPLQEMAYSFVLNQAHISSMIVGFKNLVQARTFFDRNPFRFIPKGVWERINEVHRRLPNVFLEY